MTPTPSEAQPVAWRQFKHGAWLYYDNRPPGDAEPLHPEAALDAERQKLEAAERERDELIHDNSRLVDVAADEATRAEAAESSLAKANERIAEMEAALREITAAANGLSHGADWNNGVHAKRCGYRQMLLNALPKARAAITNIEKERDDGR